MELFDNSNALSLARAAMFSPGGSKARIVDTLPPTGTPGQTIIVQNGGNFYYYIWNSVTNSWVQIVNNNYVTHYNGDDYDSDVSGPRIITTFDDLNWWTPYELSPHMYMTFAGGAPTFQSNAAAVAQTKRYYTGIVCRKCLFPNRAGLIDIEYWMDNVGDNTQIDATHGFDLALYLQGPYMSSSGIETIWCGITRMAGLANGQYLTKNVRLTLDGSETIGSTAAPGTSITSYKMRFQVMPIAGATWVYYLDRPNLTYEHNGAGGFVAIGGAAAGTGWANSCPVFRGFVLGVGAKNNLQGFDPKVFGRLVRIIIYSGRLISW